MRTKLARIFLVLVLAGCMLNLPVNLYAQQSGYYSATAQVASIATTNLITSPPPGVYRVNVYVVNTRAATTSSSINATVGWTDDQQAQTAAGTAVTTNTLGDTFVFSRVIQVASVTAITIATTYASVGATSFRYNVYVSTERLN